MKLVALKAEPMVPWFDSIEMFREIGIFNLGEQGVFVISEYNGDKEWTNLVDPQVVLDAESAKVMTLKVPEVAAVGAEFTLAGEYAVDGNYMVMIGSVPVSISVASGKFSRKVAMQQPGVFQVRCDAVPCNPSSITVAL